MQSKISILIKRRTTRVVRGILISFWLPASGCKLMVHDGAINPASRRRRTGSGDACEISSTICWKVNSGFTYTICHGKRHFLFLSITLNENKSPSDNSRSESHSVIFFKLLQSSRLPLPNQLYFSASTSYVWAAHRGRPRLSVKLVK